MSSAHISTMPLGCAVTGFFMLAKSFCAKFDYVMLINKLIITIFRGNKYI